MSNKNPIFAILPPEILSKTKRLADEVQAEERVRELVGRRMFSVTAVILLLTFINGANGYTFMTTATALTGPGAPWVPLVIFVYSLVVFFGGTFAMFSAFMAWMELLACRGSDLPADGKRLYRRRTWFPLIPLSLLPALFNAWFSFHFFVALISLLFVVLLLYVLVTDV